MDYHPIRGDRMRPSWDYLAFNEHGQCFELRVGDQPVVRFPLAFANEIATYLQHYLEDHQRKFLNQQGISNGTGR